MRKTIMATGLALVLGSGAALAQTSTSPSAPGSSGGMQMTQAQCDSLWNRIDTGQSGSVTQSQAQNYVTSFSTADANSDGRLSKAEFTNACQRGQVRDTASTGSGTGTTGATGGMSGSGTTGSGTTGSGATGSGATGSGSTGSGTSK